MTAQWYYTSNNEQRGPVTWPKLRELAAIGMLKPSDLVWTDGMDEWVKARQQDGLFDGIDVEEEPEQRKSRFTEAKPSAGRRPSRDRDDADAGDDDARTTRPTTKRRSGEGMPAGLKVLLVLGVVFVLIVMGGGCIGGIVWFSLRPAGGGQRVHDSYTVNNLLPKGDQFRDYRFTRGRRVIIIVNNDMQVPQPDVDLYVHRLRDNQLVGADILVPAQNRNCRVEFVVPDNDTYRVRLVNLGPGMARRCNVRVDEN
jgi:hypothetical protein